MRSFIKQAIQSVSRSIINQQFEILSKLASHLVPIVEPEVDIHCPGKAKAEDC